MGILWALQGRPTWAVELDVPSITLKPLSLRLAGDSDANLPFMKAAIGQKESVGCAYESR